MVHTWAEDRLRDLPCHSRTRKLLPQLPYGPQAFLAQAAIRNEMLMRQRERELAEERQEWAREMNKAYEKWFQDIQAHFLASLSYGLGMQQFLAYSLNTFPGEVPALHR